MDEFKLLLTSIKKLQEAGVSENIGKIYSTQGRKAGQEIQERALQEIMNSSPEGSRATEEASFSNSDPETSPEGSPREPPSKKRKLNLRLDPASYLFEKLQVGMFLAMESD